MPSLIIPNISQYNNEFMGLRGNACLTMEDCISSINFPLLDVEEMLIEQKGCREVPFAGMDKSGRGVCLHNERGMCKSGNRCPLRHIIGDKAVVCKHWLRGLCKKGDQCEFLHEYDLSKMPECFFFSKYSACSNRECPFRHIDPESKIKDCPWYDRGFCRHGPFCKNRHRRRVFCPNFLAGFCQDGKECKFAHPTFNLPPPDLTIGLRPRTLYNVGIICHNCHERGHKSDHSLKATYCPHLPTQTTLPVMEANQVSTQIGIENQTNISDKKCLSDVTCYKCGEKGHYANKCHKGILAFLSNKVHLAHEQRERDEKEARLPMQNLYVGSANRPQPSFQINLT